MMSNPPPSLQRRQGLHRRQNSTPVAFEAMKVQMPPNTVQRQTLHRRGQSHDISRSPIRRRQQNGSAVSMYTNIGPIQGQQILREAQQQRIARPGQQHPQIDTIAAQQCAMFPQPQSLPTTPYNMTMNGFMSVPEEMMQHSQFLSHPVMPTGNQGTYILDENNQYYNHALNHLQEAIPMMSATDRRMSQPELRLQTGLRPYTPTHQLQTAHFPLTPATTPMQHQQIQYVKSLQNSPKWPHQDENIISPRPVSMQKSRSLQGIAEHQEIQSFSDIFDAPNTSSKQISVTALEPTKNKAPTHSKSVSMPSFNHDVESLFGEISEESPFLEELPQPILKSSQPPSSPTRPALSPRRMSISDLNLEPGISASIEETNITLDDIAQFIEGPDPVDNKWICKYEDCDKRFGRKENIKSHVQTHLGDRQFRCDHCKKCFVRGHDLKRHAKIHTGSKAYACLCGNAFARHDALTRHRQRGMCIGAFEGIVRKEIKRGRPRKHRPDMDDRLDKASRSRRDREKSQKSQDDAYASSASNCSLSSWGSPPTQTMDNLSISGRDPHSPAAQYDDLFDFASQGIGMSAHDQADVANQISLDDVYSFTPPTSPGYSTGNQPSPQYRELTPSELAPLRRNHQPTLLPAGRLGDEFEMLPSQSSRQTSQIVLEHSKISSHVSLPPALNSTTAFMHDFRANDLTQPQSLNRLMTTQSTSLPSLSHSSSPPPLDSGSALVFDFPEDVSALRMSTMSNLSSLSFGLGGINKLEPFSQSSTSSEEQPRNEFDSFLDYNDDSQMGMITGLDSDAFFAGMN